MNTDAFTASNALRATAAGDPENGPACRQGFAENRSFRAPPRRHIHADGKPTCILHVGMPKTGTSSIQDSLFFGLEDPAYRYISLGQNQASETVLACFLNQPHEFWVFRMLGFSKSQFQRMQTSHVRRLRRALAQARGNRQTPILSTEDCWVLPSSALHRLRAFLESEGFHVAVIAYVRPIKSWLESFFQQRNKWKKIAFKPFQMIPASGNDPDYFYAEKLKTFSQLFGRENITVRPFVSSTLKSNCAVQDFCDTTGIKLDPNSILRSNESLSADATRLLYAYNHFCDSEIKNRLVKRITLAKYTESLQGPPLRFHSSVFQPIKTIIASQNRTLHNDYGVDISEDLRAHDDMACVREETDLFRFSKASLEWLAEASDSKVIRGCDGEATAREVAVQMDRLCRRPLWGTRWELIKEKIRTKHRWIQKGD